MRPQHITAENGICRVPSSTVTPRFNEAAAYHCGKLEDELLDMLDAIGLQ